MFMRAMSGRHMKSMKHSAASLFWLAAGTHMASTQMLEPSSGTQ